jgi:hypothetical protein
MRLWNLKWIVLGLLWTGTAWSNPQENDFSVRAYLDRQVVGVQSQFSLFVELSGSNADKASQPQLPDMSGFASLLSTGSQYNISIVNNRRTITYTYSYIFQPLRTGEFTIGPVTVPFEGKSYKTEPLNIKIQKGSPARSRGGRGTGSDVSGADDIFIRAYIDRKKIFENEQAVVTYKIYTAVTIEQINFSGQPDMPGFWMEAFELPVQPPRTTEVIGGKRYLVAVIRKVSVFPLASGKKEIGPLSVECLVRERRRSVDPFDFDSIFDNSFFGRTVRKRVTSNALEVDVVPVPAYDGPGNFTGQVGKFQISARMDTVHVDVNQAVTFTLTLRGEGNIPALPDPAPVFPPDFEVYPPKVSSSVNRKGVKISGSKTYEYVLVPRHSGSYTIPPVSYVVFEPRSASYQNLTTASFHLEVARSREGAVALVREDLPASLRRLGEDIHPLRMRVPLFQTKRADFIRSPVFWCVSIIPLLGLVGAFMVRRHQDRMLADQVYARRRRASRWARKRLAQARGMGHGDPKAFYTEIGKALLGYVKDKLDMVEADMITDTIEKTLLERGASPESVERFSQCLRTCDLKRFSPLGAESEEMRQMLQMAEQAMLLVDKDLR